MSGRSLFRWLPPPGRPAPSAPAAAGAAAHIASSGQTEMTALVARMRVAAREAGLDDDGPITPLLQAFMLALDRLGALSDRTARLSEEHVAGIRGQLAGAREAAEAETARFRAGLDVTKAAVINEIACHIAKSASSFLGLAILATIRHRISFVLLPEQIVCDAPEPLIDHPLERLGAWIIPRSRSVPWQTAASTEKAIRDRREVAYAPSRRTSFAPHGAESLIYRQELSTRKSSGSLNSISGAEFYCVFRELLGKCPSKRAGIH